MRTVEMERKEKNLRKNFEHKELEERKKETYIVLCQKGGMFEYAIGLKHH
jgi:hypothetical protein